MSFFKLLPWTFLLCGCASMPMTRTGFLEDYEALEPAPERTVRFVPDGIELFRSEALRAGSGHESVLIESVTYEPGEGEDYRPKNGAAERLARYFERRLRSELGRDFEVVETARVDTLRVRAAITAINPSNVPVNVVTMIALFPFDMGGVSGEVEILDAQSGKRMAAMTLCREGTPFLFLECFNRHGHARHSMKKWARLVREVLEPDPKPERKEPPFTMIEGEPMYEVLPPDAILAIDEPEFVSALEAAEFMAADEPVLGVVGKDGTAKCYSTWALESHEIVHDEVDGEPIAATW